MTKDELKRRIFEAIDSRADEIIGIGERILKNPEMGFKGPESYGGSPCGLMLYVEDVDAFASRVWLRRQSDGGGNDYGWSCRRFHRLLQFTLAEVSHSRGTPPAITEHGAEENALSPRPFRPIPTAHVAVRRNYVRHM